jgi:hypothetical protein
MEVTSYGRIKIINFKRFNLHIERDMTEVSIGVYAHIVRYDSAWIGIKIPFFTFEFSWDMFDEEKAPRYVLNIPDELKEALQEMELQKLLKENKL